MADTFHAYIIRNRQGLMLDKDREAWTPDLAYAAGFEFYAAAEWTALFELNLDPDTFHVEPAVLPDPKLAADYQRYLAEFPRNDPRD